MGDQRAGAAELRSISPYVVSIWVVMNAQIPRQRYCIATKYGVLQHSQEHLRPSSKFQKSPKKMVSMIGVV
jgi:hypothetical protein